MRRAPTPVLRVVRCGAGLHLPGLGGATAPGARFCGACGAALETPAPPVGAEGELKLVSVVFCDIVGSTGLAERIGAEAMHELLDGFVAARLQALAEPGEILVGEATARLVADRAVLEPVGPLRVRGRAAPIEAFRLHFRSALTGTERARSLGERLGDARLVSYASSTSARSGARSARSPAGRSPGFSLSEILAARDGPAAAAPALARIRELNPLASR